VPITPGTFSWVGEFLLGEFDERVSIVDREVATFVDECLHRVRQVDTLGCRFTTECAERSRLGQELAHVVGRVGEGVDVLEAEGRCSHVVLVVVQADQIDGYQV
jgi:hypothetical protein